MVASGHVWVRFTLRHSSADVVAALLPLPQHWRVAITARAHWEGHVNRLYLQGPSTTRFAVAHSVECTLVQLQTAGSVAAFTVNVPKQGPDLY